jgi:hypothetical protein
MATITLGYTPADGDTANPVSVMKNFFDPAVPPVSFAEFNGGIDVSNFSDKEALKHYHIHPGQLLRGRHIGGTANRDFFSDVFFIESSIDIAEGTEPLNYIPVPNAGLEFHLPYAPSAVLLTWMIEFANDAREADSPGFDTFHESTLVKLYVDDAEVQTTRRMAASCMKLDSARPYRALARQKDRRYSGFHWLTGMTVGWHSAGLRIVSNARQSRVRTTNFKYLVWR